MTNQRAVTDLQQKWKQTKIADDVEEVNSPWNRKEKDFENPLIMDMRRERNKSTCIIPIDQGVNNSVHGILGKAPKSTGNLHQFWSNTGAEITSDVHKTSQDPHADKHPKINDIIEKSPTINITEKSPIINFSNFNSSSNLFSPNNYCSINTPSMVFTAGIYEESQPQISIANISSLIKVPIKDGTLTLKSTTIGNKWKRQKSKTKVNRKRYVDSMNAVSKKRQRNEQINNFSSKKGKDSVSWNCQGLGNPRAIREVSKL